MVITRKEKTDLYFIATELTQISRLILILSEDTNDRTREADTRQNMEALNLISRELETIAEKIDIIDSLISRNPEAVNEI